MAANERDMFFDIDDDGIEPVLPTTAVDLDDPVVTPERMAYMKELAKQLKPKSPDEYQSWYSLTKLAPDPMLQPEACSSSFATAIACREWRITFLAWHMLLPLVAFWKQFPQLAGSKTGMPPCPHCWNHPQGHGKVTGKGWPNYLQRIIALGCPGFISPYQYKCQNCPAAAAQPNRKGELIQVSYFLSNDPGLLSILLDQNLDWAVHYCGAIKSDRLGMDYTMFKYMERGMARTANLKDTIDGVDDGASGDLQLGGIGTGAADGPQELDAGAAVAALAAGAPSGGALAAAAAAAGSSKRTKRKVDLTQVFEAGRRPMEQAATPLSPSRPSARQRLSSMKVAAKAAAKGLLSSPMKIISSLRSPSKAQAALPATPAAEVPQTAGVSTGGTVTGGGPGVFTLQQLGLGAAAAGGGGGAGGGVVAASLQQLGLGAAAAGNGGGAAAAAAAASLQQLGIGAATTAAAGGGGGGVAAAQPEQKLAVRSSAATTAARGGGGAAAAGSVQQPRAAAVEAAAPAAGGAAAGVDIRQITGTAGSSGSAGAAAGQHQRPGPSWLAEAANSKAQQQQRVEGVKYAVGDNVFIGGIHFPDGYPISLPNRKLSQCKQCKVPLQVPDLGNPAVKQLKPTPIEQHMDSCPRKAGTATYQSGKKQGQLAAAGKYRK